MSEDTISKNKGEPNNKNSGPAKTPPVQNDEEIESSGANGHQVMVNTGTSDNKTSEFQAKIQNKVKNQVDPNSVTPTYSMVSFGPFFGKFSFSPMNLLKPYLSSPCKEVPVADPNSKPLNQISTPQSVLNGETGQTPVEKEQLAFIQNPSKATSIPLTDPIQSGSETVAKPVIVKQNSKSSIIDETESHKASTSSRPQGRSILRKPDPKNNVMLGRGIKSESDPTKVPKELKKSDKLLEPEKSQEPNPSLEAENSKEMQESSEIVELEYLIESKPVLETEYLNTFPESIEPENSETLGKSNSMLEIKYFEDSNHLFETNNSKKISNTIDKPEYLSESNPKSVPDVENSKESNQLIAPKNSKKLKGINEILELKNLEESNPLSASKKIQEYNPLVEPEYLRESNSLAQLENSERVKLKVSNLQLESKNSKNVKVPTSSFGPKNLKELNPILVNSKKSKNLISESTMSIIPLPKKSMSRLTSFKEFARNALKKQKSSKIDTSRNLLCPPCPKCPECPKVSKCVPPTSETLDRLMPGPNALAHMDVTDSKLNFQRINLRRRGTIRGNKSGASELLTPRKVVNQDVDIEFIRRESLVGIRTPFKNNKNMKSGLQRIMELVIERSESNPSGILDFVHYFTKKNGTRYIGILEEYFIEFYEKTKSEIMYASHNNQEITEQFEDARETISDVFRVRETFAKSLV